MAGMGGEFQADSDLRIALTGAPMRAGIDGTAVAWNASHLLPAGARLAISTAQQRQLWLSACVGGGIQTPELLGRAFGASGRRALALPLAEGRCAGNRS